MKAFFNLSRYARKYDKKSNLDWSLRQCLKDCKEEKDSDMDASLLMDRFYVSGHGYEETKGYSAYIAANGDIIIVMPREHLQYRRLIADNLTAKAFDRWDNTVYLYDPEDYAVCADCGDVYNKEDMTCIDDEYYCEYCRDERFTYCEHCYEWHESDECSEVHIGRRSTQYWCKDCIDNDAFTCVDCGEIWSDDYRNARSDGEYICDRCDENYTHCYNCGTALLEEDVFYDEDSDSSYCRECYNDCCGERSHIRSYHNNPERHYHRTDEEYNSEEPTRKYIGTEVETEKGDVDERVEFTWEFGQEEYLIYQMHDGSLDDATGIECITQPMTKKFFDQFDFEGWMKGLVERGARAHDAENCGLHVHLSREWMETEDEDEQTLLVGRMRQFIADNMENVKRYARRSEERWCRYSKTFEQGEKDGLSDNEIKQKHISKVKNDCDRYQAINNRNAATIEFRIFKGTLNPNTYRASVEFCLRVVDYVKSHEDKELSWSSFMMYKELPQSMKTYMDQRRITYRY